MPGTMTVAALILLVFGLASCGSSEAPQAGIARTGFIANAAIDEASGMQAGRLNPDVLFVHNDDGLPVLYAMEHTGADLGAVLIAGATNRDWEDLAAAPSAHGPLLVVADTGDNMSQRDRVTLYFVPEPAPGANGRYAGAVPPAHTLNLTYPDGPRDCESVAYDPAGARLLFLSKRDRPPRIYAIAMETALARDAAQLQLVGTTVSFRPPSGRDLLSFGQRDGPWAAQPTGFDIAADGRTAAVISYRSLYLFNRLQGEGWEAALGRKPIEFEAPPGRKEEAISFVPGGAFIMVTTEGRPAPVYRFTLPEAVRRGAAGSKPAH